MNIHFCTFGSNGFEKTLERIEKQAVESKYFTHFHIYNHLNLASLEEHKAFVQKKRRGYGYWIWKPLVILDVMSKTSIGDIIFYCDAGCQVLTDNKRPQLFQKYVDDVLAHPSHRLGWSINQKEESWTKQDLFEYLDMDHDEYKKSRQVCGGLQMIVYTAENRQFMEEWLRIMTVDDYHYVDDTPSLSPNCEGFVEHRHDQSVQSLLKKKWGFCDQLTGIPDTIPIHPSRRRDR